MTLSGLYNTILKIRARGLFKLAGILSPGQTLARSKEIKNKRIIVYSMGKVGSSSIYYSLMKFFPFTKIYHNHFLSDTWLKERLPGTPYTRNITLGDETLAAISSDAKESKYIVLVREPIARDLSNIIQNYKNKDIDLHNLSMQELSSQIEQEDHGFAAEWFETEFNHHLGVDIYSLPFDKDAGYSIHQLDPKTSLLVIKLEALNRVFEPSIKAFLGIDIGAQYVFNESSKKIENTIYGQLKAKYRISTEKLVALYTSDYARHFYTDTEISKFIAKWKNDA